MIKTIVAICENSECAQKLEEAGKILNVDVKYEIQSSQKKIDSKYIKEATAILFAIDGEVEDIEGIERFIDCEYYEVDSKTAIEKPSVVIKEIMGDLN